MNTRLKLSLFGFGMMLSTALTAVGLNASVSAVVDNSPDCDNVAIIRCGAFTPKALREKASQGDVPRVFNAFGIKQSELNGFVDGIVWRDGRVTVDGKVVATDAMTAGRNFGGTPIPNTNNAGKYPTSKFVTEGQTAFVKMVNGRFDFAVIKSCGNPVSATPKKQPEPQQKPEAKCVQLRADRITRTQYRFTADVSVSGGATVTQYEFGFGDGMGITVPNNTYTREYKQPGTYQAKVVAHVKMNGETKKVTSPACEKAITVEDEKIRVCDLATKTVITIDETTFDATKHSMVLKDCEEVPTTPASIRVCEIETNQVITIKDNEFDAAKHSRDLDVCKEEEEEEIPQVLAATGPETIALSLFGSSMLGYGTFSYFQTRRQLINKLLGR